MMQAQDVKLYDLVRPDDPQALTREMTHLMGLMAPGLSLEPVLRALADAQRLYAGAYPGYRAANTKYHDLGHALAVTLALLRVSHGLHAAGQGLDPRLLELAVIAALFHDAGLIQTVADTQGTGAKYTIGHELRSMAFVSYYLSQQGRPVQDVEDCAQIIAATMLGRTPRVIPYRSEDARRAGQVLGASDLMAQMADRHYLEKVLLLYQEFEEARLPGFSSELDLLRQTESFYHHQAKARLSQELGDMGRFLLVHFQTRWGVDRDLYQEAIARNLEYLSGILEECEGSYRDHLRRGGIVGNLVNGG